MTEVPVYFDRQPFSHASHQLDNGWWVNVNLSADSIRQLYSNIIQATGIPEDEYDVEFW